jgi:hypothetical protein
LPVADWVIVLVLSESKTDFSLDLGEPHMESESDLSDAMTEPRCMTEHGSTPSDSSDGSELESGYSDAVKLLWSKYHYCEKSHVTRRSLVGEKPLAKHEPLF